MSDFEDDGGEDNFTHEMYTHFTFVVKLVRSIDDIVVPSTLRFKMEFMPVETASEIAIDRAFAKMRYWIDNVVNKSVAFCHDNPKALAMFIDRSGEAPVPRLANMMLITPEEPDDQHLTVIFQRKLQALAEGALEFGPVEVTSDNQIGLSFTFVGDAAVLLPTSEEWFQGERAYFKEPWWERNDGSTLDIVPAHDADLTVRPPWAFTFDFLDAKAPPKNVNIVKHQFRPTVIDGGKDTE